MSNIRKRLLILLFCFISLVPLTRGADLVVVINTLECSNYHRSAPLLNVLKENFNIKFIFPEYESRIAIKYLDEKFNLKWKNYQVQFSDSLYTFYRKNQVSECVYFPDNTTYPLISFPFSQLSNSLSVLLTIPGKIKADTIPVDPRFLFSRDIKFANDSEYLYILDAQFGSLLKMNQQNYEQSIINLADSFRYEDLIKTILNTEEVKNHKAIEEEQKGQMSFIHQDVSFEQITYYNGWLYVIASIEYYRKDKTSRINIAHRNFIIKISTTHFSTHELIPLIENDEFFYSYGPAIITGDTFYLPIVFSNESNLNQEKKYQMARYKYVNKGLQFLSFDENNLLPIEHQKFNLNYNFLDYSSYQHYFSAPFTKTIFDVHGHGFSIQLLPDIDTLPGSKFPEIKMNYMKLAFAVQYPITNFITKFDNGKVKLFSYDYSNNLPFNQLELPIKIKTLWPEEDFFKFTSINSFIHINLRNDYIVKYYW